MNESIFVLVHTSQLKKPLGSEVNAKILSKVDTFKDLFLTVIKMYCLYDMVQDTRQRKIAMKEKMLPRMTTVRC